MLIFIFGFICAIIVLVIIGGIVEKNNKTKKDNEANIINEKNLNENESTEFEDIKNQFKMLRKNWMSDLKDMERAIEELIAIRNEKSNILFNFKNKSKELQSKMENSIQLYKKSRDESLKDNYSKFALENDNVQDSIKEIEIDLKEQNTIIDNYLEKRDQLKENIENLKYQEKETLLNVNSLKRIQEIESKLNSYDSGEYLKNLDKVMEYNSKIKATKKVSMNLNKNEDKILSEELLLSGAKKKFKDDFNVNLKMEELWIENNSEKLTNSSNKVENSCNKKMVDNLFS